VSRGIHRHTPHAVPNTSSHVTTMKAPTYNPRLRPQIKKPTKHRYQNAPRASGRAEITSPHVAAIAPMTIVAVTAARVRPRAASALPIASAAK